MIHEVIAQAITVTGYDQCAFAGGICGRSNGYSVIDSCATYGSVTTSVQGEQVSGGICGVIGGFAVVSNSFSKCTVSKTTLWGGVCGGIVARANGANCQVTKCVYEGDLTQSAAQSYWRIYGV